MAGKHVIKAVISTLLILCVLFLAFSGTLLYFGKTGVVWGFSRSNLRAAHFYTAVLLCVLAIAHVIVSRRVYRAELRLLLNRKNGVNDKSDGDQSNGR